MSGLATLTAARGAGVAEPIGGSYTVESDGAANVTFRAIDGAGNEKTAVAEVKIDRTPPAASLSCEAGTGTAWSCKGTGSDALSGVTAVRYSVDGGAAGGGPRGRLLHRPEGQGRRLRDRPRRQHGHLEHAHARRPHAERAADDAPHEPETEEPTPRSTTEAVLLRKGGRAASSRLLGQLALVGDPEQDDRRPAAARARQGHASSSWSRSPPARSPRPSRRP